jgi:hypothetical protein
MADQWLYSRDGNDHGPVSSSTLVELAKNGQLLPSDLLWKEGMAEWKPASSFPKLFPSKADSAMPVIVVEDSNKAKELGGGAANKTMANKVASTLKSQAQTASRLAVLSAEKTKIVTVSLPLAYAALGRYFFESRTEEETFADVFKELDGIASAIAENARPIPKPKEASLTEKAKTLASQGMQLANSQKLVLQQNTLFVKLGKQAYAKQGEQAGPETLVKAIGPLVKRLATLERELAANIRKAGGKKRLGLMAAGILCGVFLIGWMLRENFGVRRGTQSQSAANHSIASRRKTTKEQKAGKATAYEARSGQQPSATRATPAEESTGASRQSAGPSSNSNTNAFATEYTAMIQDRQQRTCAEVYCALERYMNNGSILPQSRTYDLTLAEIGDRYGMTTSSNRGNTVVSYKWDWRAAGPQVPLSTWEQICGATRAVPLTKHGEGFTDADVQNLRNSWGDRLKEIAYEAVDGTLLLVGTTNKSPLGGEVFRPHVVIVIPSDDPARRALKDVVKRKFRSPPSAEKDAGSAMASGEATKEDHKVQQINKRLIELQAELDALRAKEGQRLNRLSNRDPRAGDYSSEDVAKAYYHREKIAKEIRSLEREKERIRMAEADERNPRSKLSPYEKGRIDGVTRAKNTKAYVTTFPDTLDERAAVFWFEDVPKYKKAAEASEYWKGYYETAIQQWAKEGLPMLGVP